MQGLPGAPLLTMICWSKVCCIECPKPGTGLAQNLGVRSTELRSQKLHLIFIGISVESDLSSSGRCFWRRCGSLAGGRFHPSLTFLTPLRSCLPWKVHGRGCLRTVPAVNPQGKRLVGKMKETLWKETISLVFLESLGLCPGPTPMQQVGA